MKIKNQLIALFLAVLILSFGCNKDGNPPISQGDISACHHEMTWNSLKIKNALIGEWEWEYTTFGFSGDASDDEFEGLTIEFKSDNTLNVKENNQTIQTSNWTVVNDTTATAWFSIDVDPGVDQLYGQILFCEEIVKFNEGYIDGWNNYFKRKK